jgi:hypothetical protein
MLDPMLVNWVMQGLSQLLPAVGPAAGAAAGTIGTAIVTAAGTDLYDKTKEQAKRLFDAIRQRFAQEPDGAGATRALQTYVEGDRDFEPVVTTKIERILNQDPAFAAQVLAILRSGPLQSLIVGEEASAKDIEMSNSAGGGGTQTIQTGKKSEVERVKFTMTTPDHLEQG